MTQNSNRGAQNLLILGAVSILVAFITTGVSLVIYHNSGDIYLDRSRPGFLPDEAEAEEEIEKEEQLNYLFNKNGKITTEILDEYLKEIKIEIDAIDTNGDVFSDKNLLNEELGIPNE